MRTGECCLFVKIRDPSFPGHAPGKDTLRAANAATERGLTGENARANAVSGRALSPVKIKIPVASADMRRHSDTLRGAQRRRKRGLRGENNRTSFLRSKVVVFPSYTKDIVFSRTCAGKRHPESRERGDEREVHGEKTHERASCEVRVLSSRLFSLSSRQKNQYAFPQ